MRRGARALVYVAIFGLAACGKDVEDPSFNSDSGPPGGEADTANESEGNDTVADDDDDDDDDDQGNDGTTTDEPMEDTGPVADTGNPTTGPVDDGMMDAGGGCGDGMVSPGEQCDGADLQGFDCQSLGLSGGTLACDPVTCTFDTSMCMSGGGGTGGLQ